MEIYVLNLVKDKKTNKTVGADIIMGTRQKRVTLKDLMTFLNNNPRVVLNNAVVVNNESLRGKPGERLSCLYMNTVPNAVEQRDIVGARRIKISKNITVYHGSKQKILIPKFGVGKENNDYGQGFYTTPNLELAKEWSYADCNGNNRSEGIGYVHSYINIDIQGLNVIDFTEIDSMHWVAELLQNREINVSKYEGLLADRLNIIHDLFKLDTSRADILIGYRADDSYFSIAEAFVSSRIYRETMEKAFRSGDLGLQVFFKSKEAFKRLNEANHKVESVDIKYREKYRRRDAEARSILVKLATINKTVRNKESIDKILEKYGGM